MRLQREQRRVLRQDGEAWLSCVRARSEVRVDEPTWTLAVSPSAGQERSLEISLDMSGQLYEAAQRIRQPHLLWHPGADPRKLR